MRTRASAVQRAGLLLAALLPLLAGPVSETGCGGRGGAPEVLLIGLGAADWNLIRPLMAAGQLPHLTSLVAEGTHGPLWSHDPLIAPVAWTTLATGKGPDKHGVLEAAPGGSEGRCRRAMAFWNILSARGRTVAVVGWPGSAPADSVRGLMLCDRFVTASAGGADSAWVWPPARQADLGQARDRAARVSTQDLAAFVQMPAESLEAARAQSAGPVHCIAALCGEMRAAAALAGEAARSMHPQVLAVCFPQLEAAQDAFLRSAPPLLPFSTDEERQRFGGTVAAFYREADRLVGDLLALAGEQTTVLVVSDYGVRSGYDRPVPGPRPAAADSSEAQHRREGVLLARGPRIKARAAEADPAAIITDGRLLDITPTLLFLCDLPLPADMDGRPLRGLMRGNPALPPFVESFEGERWRAARRALRDAAGGCAPSTLGRLHRAEYLISRERLEEAGQTLHALTRERPDWGAPWRWLGAIALRRERYAEARDDLRAALDRDPRDLWVTIQLARALDREGSTPEAATLLERGAWEHPYDAGVRLELGRLLGARGDLDRAAGWLAEAVRLNPEQVAAHYELARIHERRGESAQAIAQMEEVVRLRPGDGNAQRILDSLRKGQGTLNPSAPRPGGAR